MKLMCSSAVKQVSAGVARCNMVGFVTFLNFRFEASIM